MDERASFSLNNGSRSDRAGRTRHGVAWFPCRYSLKLADDDAQPAGSAAARVSEGAGEPSRGTVPWWTTASAGAAPVLLIAGFLIAASIQRVSYNPIHDTISALASPGATDPWVMTTIILAVGACYVATALGLRPARYGGRVALAGGGLATAFIAAFPTPLHGYSRAHLLAVVAAAATMSVWPLLAAHRQHQARLMTRVPNAIASAITLSLLIWFALATGGGDIGLAERFAAVAPALWLFLVAFGARRSLAP